MSSPRIVSRDERNSEHKDFLAKEKEVAKEYSSVRRISMDASMCPDGQATPTKDVCLIWTLRFEPADLDKVIAVNVQSATLGHKYAAKQFLPQGGGGAIVTTASVAGLQGGWGPSAYAISKHAVLGVIRQAVAEDGSTGIRTNAIAPGIIMTPLLARTFGVPPERAEEFIDYLTDVLKDTQPIGRIGQPVDIANAAVFLGNDESSFMTGAIVPVDGGATALTQGTFGSDVVQAAADFNALGAANE